MKMSQFSRDSGEQRLICSTNSIGIGFDVPCVLLQGSVCVCNHPQLRCELPSLYGLAQRVSTSRGNPMHTGLFLIEGWPCSGRKGRSDQHIAMDGELAKRYQEAMKEVEL